jgi:hypothetical protein
MDTVDWTMVVILTIFVMYAVNLMGFEFSAMLVLLSIAGMVADTSKGVDA